MSKSKPKFYTQYNGRKRVPGLLCEDGSKTIQSEAASCDINVIIGKYKRAEISPFSLDWINDQRLFGDFSHGVDYRSAHQSIIDANEAFDGVPAEIRKQFDNDPAKFYDFVTDEKNAEKLYELGLAVRPEGGSATTLASPPEGQSATPAGKKNEPAAP